MIRCPQCHDTYSAEAASCATCGFQPRMLEGVPAWAPDLAYAGGGFKPEYFAQLEQLEAGNFWFRNRSKLVVWALNRWFPAAESILEIGCGTGYVLKCIAEGGPRASLSGSEVFVAGLAFARTRVPSARIVQMDARRIPYEQEFSVIGACDVLEHIAEDETVLRQMNRALRPGGGIIVTVPQHKWLWSPIDEQACHTRRYSACELHRKLLAAGFEILLSTSFMTLLLPLMLASRLWIRGAPDCDPIHELRVPAFTNRLFEAILGIELLLIERLGLRLPIGGSRLVVARKIK